MVVILRPDIAAAGAEQERSGTPLTWTVHAPHWAMPHPYLVPVRPKSSRITQSSGVPGSPSKSRSFPLTLSVSDICAVLLDLSAHGARRANLDPRSDQRPKLLLRAGCGFTIAAGHPGPA